MDYSTICLKVYSVSPCYFHLSNLIECFVCVKNVLKQYLCMHLSQCMLLHAVGGSTDIVKIIVALNFIEI